MGLTWELSGRDEQAEPNRKTMNCPHCNENVDYILAHDCPQIVTPPTKPEPTREETLRSSDWVAELEAARGCLLRAESALDEAGDYRYEGQLGDVYGALWDILESQRIRSATQVLCEPQNSDKP